jgi:Holliday junction resolvase RusA-like endonuclease
MLAFATLHGAAGETLREWRFRMIEPISFFVPGKPVGQPRPRAFARKMGNGKFCARVFDAGTAESWKSAIAAEASQHKPAAPISGPVRLRIVFNLPRPKGHYVGGKIERGLRATAPVYHTGKPDADNLATAVMDALTQCGWFWVDDAQVAVLTSAKLYADSGTGAMIEIKEVQP